MRDRNDQLYSNKSNQMIQNYAWSLKERQLKIMELLCSCYMTGYYNEEENAITIGISDFMRELGSTTKGVSAKEYQAFRDTLKRLSDYSIVGIGFNGHERLIRMINTFEYVPETTQIKCYMSQDYKESMRRQPKGNTKIEFRTICNMDSRYSIKLYNLLRSWQGKGEVRFNLSYLKELLNVTAKSYDNFAKFRQAVLDVAVKEINEKTNLQVSYEAQAPQNRRGAKITRVDFKIKTASGGPLAIEETPAEGLPAQPQEPIINPGVYAEAAPNSAAAPRTRVDAWTSEDEPSADAPASIIPETEPINSISEFELDLLETVPEEVHKGEVERVRAVLDVASRYIIPSNFMDFCDLTGCDTETKRIETFNRASQRVQEEHNERILSAISAYVNRDYNVRKKSIQNPNAHFKYFLVAFEGWLLSHQY